MALDFLKALNQSALEKEFNARPARPAKDPMPKRRQTVIASIDKALAALKAGEDKPVGGIYRTKPNTDVVACKVKYGSRVLLLDGRDVTYTKDAPTFYSAVRKAVEKGELDSAINNALEGKGGATRKSTGVRKPMSAEHRAKIAAAAKARHAANRAGNA